MDNNEKEIGILAKTFGKEKRWVNWQFRKINGKMTKIPYTTSGYIASSTDEDTWSTYDIAKNASQNIGIIFTRAQDLLGIDIDHCINKETKKVEHEDREKIEELILKAATYVEISPSGEGLHLFLKIDGTLPLEANRHANFECYTSGRYFTVTENIYSEELDVRTVTPQEALNLLRIIGFPWREEKDDKNSINKNYIPSPLDDGVLLDQMFRSKNGLKIKALYNGDISAYGDDASRADMALLSHLAFWTRKDPTQMERIWLGSPLGNREKTEERKDYRDRTIANAINSCDEVFSTPSPNRKDVTSQDVRLVTIKASEVIPRPIRWLWEGKIAKGKLTLLVGNPGLGKSQISVSIASDVSTGNPWPLEVGSREPAKVVMLSGEDDFEDTIVPRLMALDANLQNISLIQFAEEKDGDKIKQRTFNLTLDIPKLELLFAELKNVALLIVDPITAYMGDTDSHKNAEVRAVLSSLSDIASKYKVAVLAVTHFNKNTNTDAQMRVMGSLAFVAASRAAFLVAKDPNDENKRLFLPMKNNLAKDTTGLSYVIEPMTVYVEEQPINTSKVKWGKEEIKQTANEALRGGQKDKSPQLMEAEDFLTEILTEKKEGIAGNVLKKMAQDAGITIKNLYKAAKEVGVYQDPAGFGKARVWKLLEYFESQLSDTHDTDGG